MLVVDRGQREPVELAGAQQVVDVRARLMLACVAVASLLQRPEIELMLGTLDVVPAGARVDRAVSGAACGGHAVEGVAAVLHASENVVHRGDTQHVAWAVFRHRVADPCAGVADDALHKLLEDLFAVVQLDLVASYTLHLLVQCFFYSLCSVSCRIAWWLVYRWKQYVGGFLPAYITSS